MITHLNKDIINAIKTFSVKIAISSNWIDYIVAILYTFFLQALTGIPHPEYLEQANANALLVLLSEEVFAYPFWLQDLSHFPLFFIFTWLWARCIGPISSEFLKSTTCLLVVAIGYGIGNELMQFFIPNRFPSLGDLIMNLVGVLSSLLSHKYYCYRVIKRKRISS